MIKAFLFDADGVLIDTEQTYAKFWGGIGQKYLPDRPNFAYEIKGMTLEKILLPFPEEVRKEIEEATHHFESSMDYPLFPGVMELLTDLRGKGYKLAMVTSSDQIKMKRLFFKQPQLKDAFDFIVTAESIKNPKPAPDCYLYAAEQLGVDIKDCVVIEDGINGLKSAHASGAYVVGLTTTHPREMVEPWCNKALERVQDIEISSII